MDKALRIFVISVHIGLESRLYCTFTAVYYLLGNTNNSATDHASLHWLSGMRIPIPRSHTGSSILCFICFPLPSEANASVIGIKALRKLPPVRRFCVSLLYRPIGNLKEWSRGLLFFNDNGGEWVRRKQPSGDSWAEWLPPSL